MNGDDLFSQNKYFDAIKAYGKEKLTFQTCFQLAKCYQNLQQHLLAIIHFHNGCELLNQNHQTWSDDMQEFYSNYILGSCIASIFQLYEDNDELMEKVTEYISNLDFWQKKKV